MATTRAVPARARSAARCLAPGGGSALTPGSSGATPAAAQRASHQAATWPARLGCPNSPSGSGPGDQDARSSNSVAAGSSAFGAESLGDHPGHRAARRRIPGGTRVECLGEPAPSDRAEQRVHGDLGVKLRLDLRHDTEWPGPARLAGRVVEQDQPTCGDLGTVGVHGRREHRRIGRQLLRRGYILERKLRAERRLTVPLCFEIFRGAAEDLCRLCGLPRRRPACRAHEGSV